MGGVGHPVAAALAEASACVASVGGVPLWSLDEVGFAEMIGAAHRLMGQVQEVVLRLVGEADAAGVPVRCGAPSTQVWVRHLLNVTPQAATRIAATARAVRKDLTATGQALADGAIGFEQAAVICRAVTQLPDDIDADTRRRAEQDLIGQAARFDAPQLARLGEHILTVVAPEIWEVRDAEALARQEEADRARRDLSSTSDRHGAVFLRGRLDAEAAAIVRAALDPLSAPRPSTDGGKDLRTAGARRADALVELCRRGLAHGDVPTAGGEPAQVIVHIPLRTLTDGLGEAAFADGTLISPGLARKAACNATLIPAVLGTNSAVLDLGRTQRLFTGARRRAVVLRDRGCAFPGCDRPPAWCDVHHVIAWHDGGGTDRDNGVLLCAYHHHVVHTGDWQITMTPDGTPEFTPPPWVDPDRRPRRNRRPGNSHRPGRSHRPGCSHRPGSSRSNE